VLPLFVQDLLHVLWLAAYKMGVPPIGLYTLSWTHGQELLKRIVRPIVIGESADGHRQSTGSVVRQHQQIGFSLGIAIGELV